MPTLDPEQWRALAPYLDEALELDEEQRVAWVSALHAENQPQATRKKPLFLITHQLSILRVHP